MHSAVCPMSRPGGCMRQPQCKQPAQLVVQRAFSTPRSQEVGLQRRWEFTVLVSRRSDSVCPGAHRLIESSCHAGSAKASPAAGTSGCRSRRTPCRSAAPPPASPAGTPAPNPDLFQPGTVTLKHAGLPTAKNAEPCTAQACQSRLRQPGRTFTPCTRGGTSPRVNVCSEMLLIHLSLTQPPFRAEATSGL